jgi:lipoyl(octanoyl) transferase
MKTWRLIKDPPQSGPFNMAVDLQLLEQFKHGDLPIFRLYGWDRSTLSLGRNEKIDSKINIQYCRNNRIPLIRRMTGGKAVLHHSDLTYSIIGEVGDPQFGEGIHETYNSLARGFLLFFQKLGLDPQLVQTSIENDLEPHLCFSVPSLSEILVDGRKLIGSAQRIRGSGSRGRFFLQHGSIPLNDPVPLMISIFRHSNELKLRSKMHSLETLGIYPEKNRKFLERLLQDSISECFEIQWLKEFTESLKILQKIQENENKFPDLSNKLKIKKEIFELKKGLN